MENIKENKENNSKKEVNIQLESKVSCYGMI